MCAKASRLGRDSVPERSTIAFDVRYVNDRYHGIGRYAYHLIEALTRLDERRRYVLYYHPNYRNSRFDLRALGRRANVELRPIHLPLYLPVEHVVWPILLRLSGAALFHSPYVVLPVLARIPLVMTVHDLIFERFPAYMPRRWLRAFYRLQLKVGLQRAAAVVTVSRATRNDLVAH